MTKGGICADVAGEPVAVTSSVGWPVTPERKNIGILIEGYLHIY